jgi:Cu(I)/Ag(I) efflux system protein CusF
MTAIMNTSRHGKVTISHDATKSLQWPATTMGFTVRDKALLGNLSVGKKVDFQLIQQGSEYFIVDAK